MDRVFVNHEGRKLLFFGGFDYHRLSQHPEVIEAANQAAREYGLSTGGSRTTTGTHVLHEQLESELAAWLQAGNVLLTGSGYLANLIAVQAAQDHINAVVIDDAAHASLRDAAIVSCAPIRYFNHSDMVHLAALMMDLAQPLVATDGVFGARGEIPPLREYSAFVTARGGWLLLDDCHGIGVVGTTGLGSWEACGISRRQLVQTGSLSKSFGSFGGLIAADAEFIDRCRSAPAFVGSTALPPPLCAAALASLKLLRQHPEWIDGLQRRALEAKMAIREMGYDLPMSPSPVISIVITDDAARGWLRGMLLANGIYPSFTTYPGAPNGGHFRFALSSAHSDAQIEQLLRSLKTRL